MSTIDDQQACPRCKTTKYRNPSLILMVNVCGHALCENCVELLFVRGSGACPQCEVPLRRSNFRVQVFEDPHVEKEVDIRKKILKDFNKKEDNFESLRDYNDYLEMVETIIFNLTNGVDIEETKRQVDSYKKENQDLIKKNRLKLSRDEEYLEELILQENAAQEASRAAAVKEEIDEKREKRRNKEALIDELMFSDQSADRILENHRREMLSQQAEKASQIPRERQSMFSTGIKVGNQNTGFLPLPTEVSDPLYEYEPQHIEYLGPEPPTSPEIQETGFLSHVRAAGEAELGGGYKSEYGCRRALTEAFCGLFFSYDAVQRAAVLPITDMEMDVS